MEQDPEPKRSNLCWLVLLFAVPAAAVAIPCVLGILVHFQKTNSTQVIGDRKEWPSELEELVAKSNLSPEDIATIEVVRVGLGAGWFCRLRQSPTGTYIRGKRRDCRARGENSANGRGDGQVFSADRCENLLIKAQPSAATKGEWRCPKG